MRKELAPRGYALTERLCVYPQYMDPEWMEQGVLDVIKLKYWSFIPRRGSGRGDRGGHRPRAGAARAIAKGREGEELSEDELTALFAETRPEVIEEMRVAADELRAELAGDRVTFVVNRNINFTNICVVGCAFCGFGQGRRSPDAYEVSRGGLRRADPRGGRVRRHRDLHAGRHPPRPDPGGVRALAAAGEGGGAAAAPARLLADGGPLHVRALRQGARRGLRVPARVRARLDPGDRRRGARRRRAPADLAQQAAGRRAGSRSSRPPTAPGCARPRR